MSRWDVGIAKHDRDGKREQEPLGTFSAEDLPAVLAEALRRAASLGAAVQVRRERLVATPAVAG